MWDGKPVCAIILTTFIPAGEGKKLSLTTSTKRSERLAALAAAAVGSGGHQVQQAEDIVKEKEAKTLHPGHSDKVKALDVVEHFIAHFLIYLHECPDRPEFRDTRELNPGDNYAYEQVRTATIYKLL